MVGQVIDPIHKKILKNHNWNIIIFSRREWRTYTDYKKTLDFYMPNKVE